MMPATLVFGTCPYAGKASVGNGALVPTPRYWCRDPALVPYTYGKLAIAVFVV